MLFLQDYPVLLMPVSQWRPMPVDYDMCGEEISRQIWAAQLTQLALPLLGLPVLCVATGKAGRAPLGVQIVAARYREDLCPNAGEEIAACGAPILPIDPAA